MSKANIPNIPPSNEANITIKDLFGIFLDSGATGGSNLIKI
jgi:hypothetical protein